MKKLIVFVVAVSMALPAICRNDSRVTVLEDNADSLRVSFVTGALTFGETTIAGERFSTISMDGLLPSNPVGRPLLPIFSQLIEVPLCQGFEVRVSDAEFDTVDAPLLPLVPVQPQRAKSDTSRHPLVIDEALYAANAYYGEAIALVEPFGIARDRNLARLQFSPVSYNPVSRKLVVCRRATVTIVYSDADAVATKELFERYHTPAFSSGANTLNSLYPKSVSSTAPVRYLIVAHSMFRGQLNTFVQWKRRKGFIVDVAYTDSSTVGTTTTSIAAYVKSQYTNATAAKPAPTYLLLVGDVAQIPAFTGESDNDHVTDLYYTTWTTGDHVPDCYCGRFSAQNLSQLTPQIEKTLMYEQYTFADPTFLDRAVMVSGVDAGNVGDNAYTYGDPSMDYAITNYINGNHGFQQVKYFKNNTSIVPSATNVIMNSSTSANAALVRSCYNEGAGLINYTAHGSPTCWGTPYFGTDNIPSMSNYQKFGLMIGNCCQSNTFTQDACFGEALLRKGNYCGAVGYIGASNSTYWTSDFYWTVGARTSVSATMSMAYTPNKLGAYDRLCHTHGEAYSEWYTTQAGIMMAGNMAVSSVSSSLYYWEIYHLMGDPSVMPYLTQAQPITIGAQPIIAEGTTSLYVTAVPYAYVALTDSATHTLIAAAFTTSAGSATLTLPATLPAGSYELTASAQQRRTSFKQLRVIDPSSSGAYAFASNMSYATTPVAGATVPLTLTVKNIGGTTASQVTLHLSSVNSLVSFSSDSITLPDIAAGQTVTATVDAFLSHQIADGTEAIVTATTTWGGNQTAEVALPVYVNAPMLHTSYSATSLSVLPNGTGNVTATLTNNGHASLPSSHLKLTSPTSQISIVCLDTAAFTLAVGASVTLHYSLQASSLLPQDIVVPLRVSLDGLFDIIDDTLHVFSSTLPGETFEGGNFHISGWSQGTNPWVFTSEVADGSTWSLRSNTSLSHNQTSEITLAYTVTQADSMTFRYKVSSESNYDKFHFYIDNQEEITTSGEVDWTTAAYAIQPGSHTFRFSYTKDVSVNSGSDCSWIDNIVLPVATTPVVFQTDTACAGSLFVIGNDTIATEAPTTGTHVLNGASGVTMVDYVILPSRHIDTAVVACDSLFYGGQRYIATSLIEYGSVSQESCDSVTLHLVVNHSVYDTVRMTAVGSSYQWGDTLCRTSGEYHYYASTADGCDSVITLILTLEPDSVGIGNVESSFIKVYPNPTAGIVRFSDEVTEVLVFDASGRMVARQRQTSAVDLSTMPAGTYLLQLQLSTGSTSCRVVKR